MADSFWLAEPAPAPVYAEAPTPPHGLGMTEQQPVVAAEVVEVYEEAIAPSGATFVTRKGSRWTSGAERFTSPAFATATG